MTTNLGSIVPIEGDGMTPAPAENFLTNTSFLNMPNWVWLAVLVIYLASKKGAL